MSVYVNHIQIRSWNQPVLSNEGKNKLLNGTMVAYDWAETHDWRFMSQTFYPCYPLINLLIKK